MLSLAPGGIPVPQGGQGEAKDTWPVGPDYIVEAGYTGGIVLDAGDGLHSWVYTCFGGRWLTNPRARDLQIRLTRSYPR
jgi:hypothetical protein